MTFLRREWQCPRPIERKRQTREHDEVSVKLDTREAANAQGREAVVVLQASELALYGGAVISPNPPRSNCAIR